MVRPLVPAACLIIACTTGDPAASEPATPPPSAAVEAEPTPERSPEGPEYFFAAVSQTGVEHCPNGVDFEWLDVQPTLGWTPTSGAAAASLDALMDLPVLARGYAGSAPERPPLGVEPKPCPIMQMRSDWVSTPRGTRVRRTPPTAEHFFSSSVRRLDELRVELDGDRILASFENPLPFALTGVRLRMHYEGCYGKPGATSRESEAVALAPGEVLRHEFSRIAEQDHAGPRKGGPTARRHAAAALVLEIAGGEGPPEAKVWADLDVSLRKLGIEFSCD